MSVYVVMPENKGTGWKIVVSLRNAVKAQESDVYFVENGRCYHASPVPCSTVYRVTNHHYHTEH